MLEQSQPNTPAHGSRVKKYIRWAAVLSITALIGHAMDVKDHLIEWWGYSAYFVTAGAFQFFYGFGLLLQPWRYDDSGKLRENPDRFGRTYFLLGLILTLSIVVLYLITRTSGIPFLGKQAASESVTALSLAPIIIDIPLIFCLVKLLLLTRI